MPKFNLIIKNAHLILMDKNEQVIANGYLAISGLNIACIGSGEIPADFSADQIIDAKNNLVLPGFVNTHTHAAMTIFRGFADDLPLMEWLTKYIWPAENKFVNSQTVRLGTQLACIEMIKSGITTFNDMYFIGGETAKVAKEIGIRAMIGAFTGLPEELISLNRDNHTEFIDKYLHDDLILPCIVAHSPYACSKELLLYSKEVSDKYDLPLTIHLSESDFEVEKLKSETGMTPVEYLDSLQFLNQRTVAVHSVKLTEKDIKIYQERQVGVSHNPKSNLKLANGFAPISTLQNNRIKIGLGTDGAASNNGLNMYEEIGFCARIHKGISQDPTIVTAKETLKMATIGGAEVLGLDKIIGSIEVGKRADLQIIDINKPHLTPMYNPISHLVYAVTAADVETVIINGKVVMQNRQMLTIDEQEVISNVNILAEQIKNS